MNTVELDKKFSKVAAKTNFDISSLGGSSADFRNAENFLKQAQISLNEFNKASDSDNIIKNNILYIGTRDAYLAVEGFRFVLDDNIRKLKRQGIDFELDFNEDSYKKLYHEIFEIYVIHEANLKNWSAVNTYDRTTAKRQEDYDKDWNDVTISDVGIKIYHLKKLIDYNEKLKANIARIYFASDENTDDINTYVLKGNNHHIRLSMYLSKDIPENPNEWNDEIELNLCKYCCSMFDHYFSAFLLINKRDCNIDSLSISDKLEEVLSCKEKESDIISLISFEDHLSDIITMAESNGSRTLITGYRLKSIMESSLDIATNFRFAIDSNTFKAIK